MISAIVEAWTAAQRWAAARMAWLFKGSAHVEPPPVIERDPVIIAPAPVVEPLPQPDYPVVDISPSPAIVPLPDIVPDVSAPAIVEPRWGVHGEYLDASAAYSHVNDLLNDLPYARKALHSLRKYHRDAYEFHRRFGARLIGDGGDKGFIGRYVVHPDIVALLPSAGLCFIGDSQHNDKLKEKTCPGYLYFQKIKVRPWNVEACPGAVATYELNMAFWLVDLKRSVGYTTMMALMPDGQSRPLKQLGHSAHHLPNGHSFMRRSFDLPAGLEYHRLEHFRRGDKTMPETPEQWAVMLFAAALNFYEASNKGFQITAKRDGVALTFNLPEQRSKYFFRDREIEVDDSRRYRRRIFHVVEAHTRQLKSGKTVNVASHYRGARKFMWKGEAIRIDPPEQAAKFYNLEAFYEGDVEKREKWQTLPQVARRLDRAFEDRAERRGGYRATAGD